MKTILLADDEEIIISLVSASLSKRKDYDLVVAKDGAEAVELCREHHPDVALLDVRMPHLNGLEVCQMLKSDPNTADIRVVMLSAMVQESDIKQGMSAGADDYITKPFSPTALLIKIDEVLSHPLEAP